MATVTQHAKYRQPAQATGDNAGGGGCGVWFRRWNPHTTRTIRLPRSTGIWVGLAAITMSFAASPAHWCRKALQWPGRT